MPRFHVDPPEWCAQSTRPDEHHDLGRTGRGSPKVWRPPLYRRAAAARVAAWWASGKPVWRSHKPVIIPAAKNTANGFYQDTWGTLLNGLTARPTRRCLEAWHRVRYADDEAARSRLAGSAQRLTSAGISLASPAPAFQTEACASSDRKIF